MADPKDDDASTLLQRSYDPSPPSDVAFTLTVVAGPDVGATVTVDDTTPSATLLGTGPTCELRLTDRAVSRRHVSLEVVAGALRVVDLRSTNGTRVGALRVGEGFLVGGEILGVGASELEVTRGLKTSKVTPSFAGGFGRMIGASREMRRLYPLCLRLAQSPVSLIIEGETGTGKEVLAESIHAEGPRASGPFVVFDCTSVAPNLVEAELFGHERGAFTGATATHRGVFEQAHGGTLLIDEIGDLDLHLQPKLLRVLERSEFRRLGGERAIRVDVRVMAATRRNLDREIEAGRFRDDLFHRLAVARIELPPLRERRGDVAELAAAICRELAVDPKTVLSGPQLARWNAYHWPGNVRELRNAILRFLAVGELGPLTDGSSPPLPNSTPTSTPSPIDLVEGVLAQGLPLAASRKLVVEEFERRYVERALEKHHGVVTEAAKSAGIARRHFYRVGNRGGR